METIPYNVPGLPEPEDLSSQWNLQPITVQASESGAPLLGFPAGPARASTPPSAGDGVLCVYPENLGVAYLFTSALHVRQGSPIPAVVVTTHSAESTCTIFAFSYDDEGCPLLIVNILSAADLPGLLRPHGDSTVIHLAGFDDRIEIIQTFHANSFGIVSRLSNKLTRVPDDTDNRNNTIFELFDDPATIADVCSFYMSRALALRDTASPPAAEAAGRVGFPDPSFWRLLWKPATFMGLFGFSTVYILTKLSFSFRRARGDDIYALDYNLDANRPPRGGNGQ